MNTSAKPQSVLKRSAYWLGIVVFGTIIGLSLQFAKAWTEPAAAPPGGNIGAPVNTSSTPQTKYGNLTAYNGYLQAYNSSTGYYGLLNYNGYGVYTNGGAYFGGNVGIGTLNPSGKLDVTTNGAASWAGMFNYNAGAPSGPYGIWVHGSTYALYADGPIYDSGNRVYSAANPPPGGVNSWTTQQTNCYVITLGMPAWNMCSPGYVMTGLYNGAGAWGTVAYLYCCQVR